MLVPQENPDPHGSRWQWARYKARHHRAQFWVGSGGVSLAIGIVSGALPPISSTGIRIVASTEGALGGLLMVLGASHWYAWLRAPHEQLASRVGILEKQKTLVGQQNTCRDVLADLLTAGNELIDRIQASNPDDQAKRIETSLRGSSTQTRELAKSAASKRLH